MGDYDDEYDDFYYNDGEFADNGSDDEYDDSDIPTYDELDIEGRYYTYGSREDYNAWRDGQIMAQQQTSYQYCPNTNGKRRHKPDELYASDIPTYSELSPSERDGYNSRTEYNRWRNNFIENRNAQRKREAEAAKNSHDEIYCLGAVLVTLLSIVIIILVIASFY